MNNKHSLSIIQKLIQKTKDSSIIWVKCAKSEIKLLPLAHSKLNEGCVSSAAEVISSLANPILFMEDSYVCTYNQGIFFLLLYRDHLSLNSHLELRIQTKKSENSKIFASTRFSDESDVEIASQLKRLYTLIEESTLDPEIDSFIQSFLND